MKRVSTLLLLLISICINAYGLKVKITDDGSYNMDANWLSTATSLGHTGLIVPVSMLNDTTFFDTTDILIISTGISSFTATQVTNMEKFVKSGKSVYIQAEYLITYPGNVAASTIINNLGGSFSWTGTVSGSLSPDVLGSLGTKNDTVVTMSYFWYGATGTTSCNVMAFLISNSGSPVGWMFRPPNTSYGRMIFTTDQDWVNSATSYADHPKVMKNIMRHLADTAFGDKNPTLRATVSATALTICAGTSVTYSVATINAGTSPTYQWKRNSTNVGTASTYTTTSLSNGDTIYCVVTASTECKATGTGKVIMTVNPTPLKPTVTTPVNICQGAATVALTASATSGSDTLKWFDVPTGGTALASAPVPSSATVGTTTYYVSQKNSSGCTGPRDSIKVNVQPIPTRPTVVSPVKYCLGVTAVALTATKSGATDTLKWYNVSTGGTVLGSTPVPSTSTAGSVTYYVSQKSQFGCEGSRDSIRVQVDTLPKAPVATTPITYCQNVTAVALTATASVAGDTLKWYTVSTGGTASGTAITPPTTAAGSITYYVTERNTACESSRTPIVVTTNPQAATPTGGTPPAYCVGATAAALTATAGATTDTLLWYTVSTGGTGSKTAITPSTASAGTIPYYVSGKTNLGCEGGRATINVTVNPLGVAPTVTTPVIYCQNATAIALTATKGSATDTLYWYTAATGGTGSKTAITPATTSAGTTSYYVSGKTSLGCEGSRATINVTVNPAGVTPTVTSPINYCIGATATALSATAGSSTDTLLWYTVSTAGTPSKTAPTPPTSPVGATSWYVSGKTNLGCEGNRATITVNIRPLAATPTVTTPVNYCKNIAATALTATPGSASDTLLWYTVSSGGTGNKTAPVPPTTTVGSTTWYVSGKTSFGCEGSRTSLVVKVNPLPFVDVLTLAPTGTIVCRQGPAVLLKADAPTATGYQWYYKDTLLTGAIKDTNSAKKTGFWYAVVTDVNGCKSKDSLYIQVDTSIQPTLTPTENTICMTDGSVYLTCHPGIVTYTFNWFKDGVPMTSIPTTTHIVPVSLAGIYNVQVKNNFGCTYKTNDALVNYYPAPVKPILNYTSPVLSYSGGPYIGRQWYRNGVHITGASGTTITVTMDGDYWVVVTDANGCKVNSDTINIQGMSVLDPGNVRNAVRIYPNPTQGRIMIESPVAVQAVVADINGRIILKQDKVTEIDLAPYADGLYLLYIRDEQGMILRVERINKSAVQY